MISHLITNGCSYTYCQNLDEREINGWPYQLGKYLNVEVLNLAKIGSGNDSITRRTYEHIFQMEPHKNPLFVIGWSQYWRREGWYKELNDYDNVHRPLDLSDFKDTYKKLVVEHWNVKDHARKTLLFKTQLKTLFDHKKIPYIMIDMASPDDYYFNELEQYNCITQNYDSGLDDRFRTMVDYVYDKKHLSNVSGIRYGLKSLPCGHDDIEFQNKFSIFLFGKITEIYKDHLPS